MTNFEADFELHEELGRGSNAIVYQASHIDSGEIFAVKKV
jgi:serine/threonine protein kinase